MTLRSLIPALALTAAALVMPSVASAAEGFVRSSTTLRAGPGTDYPRVSRVGGGASLEIFGCLARGSWCDVAAEGERGWLPGRSIDFLDSGRRTHLSGNFAGLGLTILSFGQSDYWGSHYAGRPWMNDRRWQRGMAPGGRTATPEPSAPHPGMVQPQRPVVDRVDAPQEPRVPHVGMPRTEPGNDRPPAARTRPAPMVEPPRAAAPHETTAPRPAPAAREAPARAHAPGAPDAQRRHPGPEKRPAGVPLIPGAPE